MSLEDAKKKIRDMSTEEKNAFFSQEAQKPDFKGQTAGQKLYGLISSYVDKKYPIDKKLPFKPEAEKHKIFLKKEISSVVGSDYFKTYINNLQALREIRSQQIMKETRRLYHFSQATPEEMGEYLTPKVQERGNALTENIGENLCYAATNSTSLYILKPPSNESDEYKNFAVYMDQPCAVISDIEFSDYIKDLKPSYRYEVDKSSFSPVVSLDGNFANEYESKTQAKILNHEGPFTIEDVYKEWDLPVYYIPNKEDKDLLKKIYSQYMKEGMSRYEAMEKVRSEFPDKMKNLNKDDELQKIVEENLKDEHKDKKAAKDIQKRHQQKEGNKMANHLMALSGFSNPKNQKTAEKVGNEKTEKSGEPMTGKDIKDVKIQVSYGGRSY